MQAHIVRIDTQYSHTYQVRYSLPNDEPGKYRSKCFSDGQLGGKRKAKKAAEEYLTKILHEAGFESIQSGRRRGMKYPESPRKLLKSNISGRNGVYRSEFYVERNYGRQRVRYWAASYSIGPDGKKTNRSRRFYIGERSEQEAKELAISFREGWENAFLEDGVRAVRRFFKEWESSTTPYSAGRSRK